MGARGYINKEQDIDDVLKAIRDVAGGQIYLSDQMSNRLLSRIRGGEPELVTSPIDQLTNREIEVFELIGNGLSTCDIAERLSLSPKTIDAHRQKAKRKLGVDSTNQLTRCAVTFVLDRTRAPDLDDAR